ncbi:MULTISPECIES: winged helix-turn-helix domain-containing protein [unclassified Micromonospora]|uniref:winged helix-turn-helix domain-containing protein n=1 Tax=unclassified Micromonospora TaxID=2617518 RepID=UPI003327B386
MIRRRPPEVSSTELARLLRDQILTGQMPPGARFHSDRWLQETYGVSRNLVRHAIAILRGEGLVVTRQGQASTVRRVYDKQPIDPAGVTRVEVRMPTAPERESMDVRIEEGVPVWVVWRDRAQEPVLLPGDRWYWPGPAAR